MTTCELCGDRAQVTVVGKPKRHYCIPCARLKDEYRPAGEPAELVFVHPPLVARPGRRVTPVRGGSTSG